MKVLHVNHVLDPVSGGGTAERTVQLTRFLIKQGQQSGILTLDIGDTRAFEQLLNDGPIFKLPCINRRYYIHITWPFHIRRIIKDFDVIHLMGHWTLLNAIVALICFSLNKPYVVCPAGALKTYGRSRKLKRIYDFLIGRWIIKKAAAWIAITEDEKRDFLAYGISPERVKVIPNGIDPEQYQLTKPIASLPSDFQVKMEESPYVLFLGRLNAIKGPDLLLSAFISLADQFPQMHLVFAGPDDGMLEGLTRMRANSTVGERIHFLGYVGGPDKVNLLRKAHCLVIPSRNEAMSVVVLEAGMCGTPVLFTDRCGLDAFADAEAGVMVKADESSLKAGLMFVLTNPERQRQYGNKLETLVRANFHWSTQANRYSRLYQELILK